MQTNSFHKREQNVRYNRELSLKSMKLPKLSLQKIFNSVPGIARNHYAGSFN